MTQLTKKNPQLVLAAETAADLMTSNPISIRADASIRETVAALLDRGFSALPVIDETGRPVGVVSQRDIMTYNRETVARPMTEAQRHELNDLKGNDFKDGFQVEDVDRMAVGAIMSAFVFSVNETTPAAKVVEEMLAMKVHRLFVTDETGVLVGVISAIDVLRHLRP